MRSSPARIALTALLAFLAGMIFRYLGATQAVNALTISMAVACVALLYATVISCLFCFQATSKPTPEPQAKLVRYQTLPAPSGLDAEVMRLLEPGKRTDLRLLLCKARDCGAILITHHEYWPDATSDTEYAKDLGWREIKVPDKPTAWYCPNHVKSARDLLG